jgi:hypothetical protein
VFESVVFTASLERKFEICLNCVRLPASMMLIVFQELNDSLVSKLDEWNAVYLIRL